MAANNSSRELTKQRLTDLRNGLLSLHKTLLDSERATYERDIARIGSSGELLKLVLYDPWFAWLHELSEFVVLIDETLDAIDETADGGDALPGIDAERFIAQSLELLAPNETGTGFAKRYFEALQRDPDVVLAHAKMRKVITNLG
jgi:fumarate hydratase class II